MSWSKKNNPTVKPVFKPDDLKGSFRQIVKAIDQSNRKIKELSDSFNKKAIDTLIKEAIEDKNGEIWELKEKEADSILEQNQLNEQIDTLEYTISEQSSKIKELKDTKEKELGELQVMLTNVAKEENDKLRDQLKEITSNEEDIDKLKLDSEIISKEKYHLIEVFGGDSNVELLKILDDDEKFRVLRNLLFELNKYGDTKILIEEHDSLKKVFDNNFKLNIVVSITKLLAEYGIDTAGFEDIRSNLNYTLDPPYSIKKPRPKEQEFDPDAHQATTEDYVGLIKNYITLTIENTETGNISVKAIVECD